ncbi:MAG: glutamate 5-kinase [Polyangiaceae bacterium]|nr:glutamate 5-kinase [Polyangiaceae bacterium]
MNHARSLLKSAQRIVIKIGSRALASDNEAQRSLAAQIAAFEASKSTVIVSSGAIAIGMKRLGYAERPKEIARLQAAAAAGQIELMRRYDEAFTSLGLRAAQVLITHADLADRERLNNARAAFAALLEANAIPIVNENDTVATDEIRFGDNDQLASMVTPLVAADLLILLTDVEGVLDANGTRISEMSADAQIGDFRSSSGVGTGGMSSKIDAARKAVRSGASVVIGPAGRPNVILDILAGEDVGTLFPPNGRGLRARQHWIAYTLRPRGALLLDQGAAEAVKSGKSSLLPIGVLGVRGQFNPGDSVQLLAPSGEEVGRGLTQLGALDAARAAGKKGHDLEMLFGTQGQALVVVHKDDLVTES